MRGEAIRIPCNRLLRLWLRLLLHRFGIIRHLGQIGRIGVGVKIFGRSVGDRLVLMDRLSLMDWLSLIVLHCRLLLRGPYELFLNRLSLLRKLPLLHRRILHR